MARPAKPVPALPNLANDEAIASDMRDATIAHREIAADTNRINDEIVAIASRYDIDLPAYDQTLYIERAGFHLTQSAQSMLQAGVILCAIKHAEPHGAFAQIIESRLGLSHSTANKMMRAAVKFGGDAGKRLLANSPISANLSKSKLFELMVMDDDDMADAVATGMIGDTPLDEIAKMTVPELRAALRNASLDLEAKDSVLADKDKKINTLTAAKRLKLSPDKALQECIAEAEKALAKEAGEAADKFFVMIPSVVAAFYTARDEAEANGNPSPAAKMSAQERLEKAINDAFARVMRAVTDTVNDLGVDRPSLDLQAVLAAEAETPWLNDDNVGGR